MCQLAALPATVYHACPHNFGPSSWKQPQRNLLGIFNPRTKTEWPDFGLKVNKTEIKMDLKASISFKL